MKRLLLLALLPLAVIVGASLLLPNRVFYRDRRPTAAGRFVNAFWARIYGLGLFPRWLARLEVPGRHTGVARSIPVAVAWYDGDRYLVSMLGERSEWVRNVRAASGRATLRHGIREPVELVEVPVERRAPIIKQYLHIAPGGRPHIPVDKDAPVADFEPVAAQYPVFRIEPSTGRPLTR
jgi:hypothetical protein